MFVRDLLRTSIDRHQRAWESRYSKTKPRMYADIVRRGPEGVRHYAFGVWLARVSAGVMLPSIYPAFVSSGFVRGVGVVTFTLGVAIYARAIVEFRRSYKIGQKEPK